MCANCPHTTQSTFSPVAIATKTDNVYHVNQIWYTRFLLPLRKNHALAEGIRGKFTCRKLPAMQRCLLVRREDLSFAQNLNQLIAINCFWKLVVVLIEHACALKFHNMVRIMLWCDVLIRTRGWWWIFCASGARWNVFIHNLRKWKIMWFPLRLTGTQEHPGGS